MHDRFVRGGAFSLGAALVSFIAITASGCLGSPVDGEEDAVDVSQDSSALQDGQVVKITSVNSGMVLDVEGISRDNGAHLHQWPYHNAANQQWRLKASSGGRFQLVSVNSGKCLDIGGTSPGVRAQQWDCWTGAMQQWELRPMGDGTFELVVAHTGQCLDVEGGSKTQGAYMVEWTCQGGASQRWRVESVSGGGGGGTTDKGRFVTILYSTWADWFRGHRDGKGQPFYQPNGAPYGGPGLYHWWGTPAFGNAISDYRFMNNNDPDQPNNALIDYHADLLHDAGVDFISIDLSNGEQDLIVKGAQAVARRYSQRPRERTPQIVFFVKTTSSVQAIRDIFYSGRYDDGIWFKYEGKPLILIANADSAVPRGGALDAFTTRHTWGLHDPSQMWSFKLNTDSSHPGKAFYLNGQPEEMSVAPATQATYMTSPEGRKCRNNGAYFAEQWSYVFKTMPKFVFVTGWNEWGSQNGGDQNNPVFVDQFLTECSSDIEPMKGGHGDKYYQLLKGYVRDFKSR